jgi:hypothetical protein
MHAALRERVRMGRDPKRCAGVELVKPAIKKRTGVGGEQRELPSRRQEGTGQKAPFAHWANRRVRQPSSRSGPTFVPVHRPEESDDERRKQPAAFASGATPDRAMW